MKIVVTGAGGLLGWHCAARLHAANCAARYQNLVEPYDLVIVDRSTFVDSERLASVVRDADAILHFAGVNRGGEAEVERANPQIARALVAACREAGARPHIVYANSIHASRDTPYGRSKRIAGEILQAFGGAFTDLVLPHIFGECARPYYNNVTATLIEQLWSGEMPTINPEGQVELLHAGAAAQLAIDAVLASSSGELVPGGRTMAITDLFDRLSEFHASYLANVFPKLDDPFDLALFNSYRTGGYPRAYPLPMQLRRDARGVLFEAAKSAGGAQTFISTTHPGQRRGDHFHIDLVERFMVVSGEAVIRIRKVLTGEVRSFEVSGERPVAIDMPPLHTHHLENASSGDVVTFFWSHRHFDPAMPDTYADPVLKENA